jgi:hypothetical protein
MRVSVTLVFLLVIGAASAATGYAVRSAADLVTGTYTVDLMRAVEAIPGYQDQLTKVMAPIERRKVKFKAAAQSFKSKSEDMALLEVNSDEYHEGMMTLQLDKAYLEGENKLLNDAEFQIRHDAFLSATRTIHLAVTELGKRKGYEVIEVLPLSLDLIDFTKPDQAFETLRQRRTMWVHPDRDVTDEVVAILGEVK